MSALGIRRRLRRQRRDIAMIAALLALGCAVAAHHGAIAMDMHHDAGMGAAAGMCLGVVMAAGAVLVGGRFAAITRALGRPVPVGRPPRAPSPPRMTVARARHGPATVSVLCVDRR